MSPDEAKGLAVGDVVQGELPDGRTVLATVSEVGRISVVVKWPGPWGSARIYFDGSGCAIRYFSVVKKQAAIPPER